MRHLPRHRHRHPEESTSLPSHPRSCLPRHQSLGAEVGLPRAVSVPFGKSGRTRTSSPNLCVRPYAFHDPSRPASLSRSCPRFSPRCCHSSYPRSASHLRFAVKAVLRFTRCSIAGFSLAHAFAPPPISPRLRLAVAARHAATVRPRHGQHLAASPAAAAVGT